MNILLVDDHAMFRHSLAFLLTSMRPEVVVDQCFNVEQALTMLTGRDRSPDLALLDLHVADSDPLAGLARFREAAAEIPVVVVSADEDPFTIRACIELGACSYVPKSAHVEELTAAIDRILGGGVWLPKPLLTDARSGGLTHALGPGQGPQHAGVELFRHITRRQKDVLLRVVQGKTNKMIGKELGISDGTVKTHLAALMTLFDTSSRTQLVFALARCGVRLDDETGHPTL